MRVFEDDSGRAWRGEVRARPGKDYKGRYYFFLHPEGSGEAEGIALLDIRWNNERTAQRTLETMSVVELRRRLRQAVGRGSSRPSAATG